MQNHSTKLTKKFRDIPWLKPRNSIHSLASLHDGYNTWCPFPATIGGIAFEHHGNVSMVSSQSCCATSVTQLYGRELISPESINCQIRSESPVFPCWH